MRLMRKVNCRERRVGNPGGSLLTFRLVARGLLRPRTAARNECEFLLLSREVEPVGMHVIFARDSTMFMVLRLIVVDCLGPRRWCCPKKAPGEVEADKGR